MFGDARANHIVGGPANDVLDGGAGADTLAGGAGDDWYFVDNAGDMVVETAGGGTMDRVFAGVDYVLPAGAEVEVLSTDWNPGTTPLHLAGNELANTIYGNAGANALAGLAGDDVIFGQAGNDAIDGGDGHDNAVFLGTRAEYAVRTALVGGDPNRGEPSRSTGPTATTSSPMSNGSICGRRVRARRRAGEPQLQRRGVAFDDVLFQNATTGQVYYAQMNDGAPPGWGVATGVLGTTGWRSRQRRSSSGARAGRAETFVQQQSTGTIYFASLDTGSTTWGVVSAQPHAGLEADRGGRRERRRLGRRASCRTQPTARSTMPT